MNRYERTMRGLARTSGMRWLMKTVQHPLDMKLKGTRFAPSTFGGMDTPLCFLTTTGRTSGQPRTVPLVYVDVGGDVVAVAASNYGQKQPPAWSLNLDADPRATLEIGDEPVVDVVATLATASETADLWPRFDSIWPGYEDYREISARTIRIYLLRPAS